MSPFFKGGFERSSLFKDKLLFRLYQHRLIQTAIRVPAAVQGIPRISEGFAMPRDRSNPGEGRRNRVGHRGQAGACGRGDRSLPRHDAGRERGGRRRGLAAQVARHKTSRTHRRNGQVWSRIIGPQESAMAVKMDVSRGWGRFHYWGAMRFYISRYFFLTSSFSRSSSMLPS